MRTREHSGTPPPGGNFSLVVQAGHDREPLSRPNPFRLMFSSVEASEAERNTDRPGDALVEPADVVMDRAFTLTAPREAVWPWLVQLGKGRAGWYLPGSSSGSCPAHGALPDP
jgi:hypothetical protein